MKLETKYKTLESDSEGMYKEKGSKFIAYAVPCQTEDKAKEFINHLRREHHQARHVCYAYRFGADKKVFRANDDGEPGNSAGIPILGQIQSFELTNVLVAVVRYFGGTKLGVGGLVNAYKLAARDAIQNGRIIEKELEERLELRFFYDELPEIMNLIKKYHLETRETNFNLNCEIILEVPMNIVNEFKEKISVIKNVELISKGIN